MERNRRKGCSRHNQKTHNYISSKLIDKTAFNGQGRKCPPKLSYPSDDKHVNRPSVSTPAKIFDNQNSMRARLHDSTPHPAHKNTEFLKQSLREQLRDITIWDRLFRSPAPPIPKPNLLHLSITITKARSKPITQIRFMHRSLLGSPKSAYCTASQTPGAFMQ